jgi:hypothetical protein
LALVAIDPGKVTGVAVFDGSDPDLPFDGIDKLKFADVCTFEDCRRVIEESAPLRQSRPAGDCIIEVPQVYPGQQQKGDQNDLIALAVMVGQYAECARKHRFRVEFVKPREWKGQLPKDVCWRRVRETLTPYELFVMAKLSKSRAHNMHDAIGLGTRFQKRWR